MNVLIRNTCIAAAICGLLCVPAIAQDSSDLDAAFRLLEDYREGDDRAALDYIAQRVSAAENTFTLKRDLEARLLSALQRNTLSPAARDFAMHQLHRVATERSVTVLEPMLYDPATSELAHLALEQAPSNSATDVLIEAMQKTSDDLREGIIYSLGKRQDQRAAKAITKFSGRGDPDVIRAAIWALGEISGPVAVKDLRWCRGNTIRQHREFAGESLLRAADRYVELGEVDAALEVYELLYLEIEPTPMRQAALRGMIRARGDEGINTVLRVLRENDPAMIDIAFDALATLPGELSTRRCAAMLPTLNEANQVRMIDVLARRNDPVALPSLHDLLKDNSPAVRLATIRALGEIGDHSSANALMAHVLRAPQSDLEAARDALIAMPGPGVNDELAESVLSPNRRIALFAIDILVERKARNAVPALKRLAERTDAALRTAALRAISVLAVRENLPSMLNMMLSAEEESARNAAREGALVALRQIAAEPNPGSILGETLLREDLDDSLRVEVAELIRVQYDPAALSALTETARKNEGAVSLAAIAVLADWPNAVALDSFADLSKSMRRHPNRGAFVTGYLAQLQASDAQADLRADHYDRVERLLETAEEKRAYLDSLRNWGTREAGELAAELRRDDEVGEEAAALATELSGD